MEFIAAKDLPVTEAEEVDVLCVENGEMKRKPAKGLGGNSYDLKVRIWFELDESEEVIPKGEVLEGSFETVKQKFDSELPALALVIEDATNAGEWDGNIYKYIGETEMTALYVPNNLDDAYIFTGWGRDTDFAITPDNTIIVN